MPTSSVRVLGCSGSIAAGCRTTAFLVDDDVLIDCGTGVGDLSLDELTRVDHIFLTHSHLDHVLGVGLLADSVNRKRSAAGRPPVVVHALPQTLAAIKAHIFNDVIWPDFTRLPSPNEPILQLHAIEVGQVTVLGERHIEALSAAHTVPAVGYAVSRGGPQFVFTGDTGPNPALWARLAHMTVQHLVIETAFGDDEQALAALSGHLSPTRLMLELQHLQQPCQVHITHIKPGEVQVVLAQIAQHAMAHHATALYAGQVFELS